MTVEIYKYLAILVAILALMTGAFFVGDNHGYTKGYEKGKSDQQVVIDTLTKQLNDEHTAANNKVTSIEQTAANSVETINKVTDNKEQQKAQIITKYVTVHDHDHDQVPSNPLVSNTCGGLTTDAVKVVNQLLDIDAAPTGLSSMMQDTPDLINTVSVLGDRS